MICIINEIVLLGFNMFTAVSGSESLPRWWAPPRARLCLSTHTFTQNTGEDLPWETEHTK